MFFWLPCSCVVVTDGHAPGICLFEGRDCTAHPQGSNVRIADYRQEGSRIMLGTEIQAVMGACSKLRVERPLLRESP